MCFYVYVGDYYTKIVVSGNGTCIYPHADLPTTRPVWHSKTSVNIRIPLPYVNDILRPQDTRLIGRR